MNGLSGMIKAVKILVIAGIFFLTWAVLQPVQVSAEIVADHTRTGVIPESAVNLAKSNLHIAYGHTSHGSQLVTGMDALMSHDPLYSWSSGGGGGALDLRDSPFSGANDLGNPDRTAWATATRNYLNSHTDVNVIIWSWCGQVDASETDIQQYLDLMSDLENDFPNVRFVYMTGHLNGTGATGNVNLRNNQIRAHVHGTNRILFDFADIESYDPSGAEFLSRMANDGCYYNSGNWAVEWVTANPSSELTHLSSNTHCGSCAHSEKLNCVQKGRAVWWLWARIAGWNGDPSTDNVRIIDTPYATLGDAYLHAGDVDTLKARDITFPDVFDLNREVDVTLQGGYNEDYSDPPSGFTTQGAKLTVSAGSLTVDRLVVQ